MEKRAAIVHHDPITRQKIAHLLGQFSHFTACLYSDQSVDIAALEADLQGLCLLIISYDMPSERGSKLVSRLRSAGYAGRVIGMKSQRVVSRRYCFGLGTATL